MAPIPVPELHSSGLHTLSRGGRRQRSSKASVAATVVLPITHNLPYFRLSVVTMTCCAFNLSDPPSTLREDTLKFEGRIVVAALVPAGHGD